MNFSAKLDRIEDERAILITEDHQIIVLPRNLLPIQIKIGEDCAFAVGAVLAEGETEAKKIINELLRPE